MWNFALISPRRESVLLSQIETSSSVWMGWDGHPAVWSWGRAGIWVSIFFGWFYFYPELHPRDTGYTLIPQFWGPFQVSQVLFALHSSVWGFTFLRLPSKSSFVHLLSSCWHQYPADGNLGHLYSFAIINNAETEILVCRLKRKFTGRWDGWMASPTQWMWVWVNSRRWWWTGRPGVLQFMGLQRVGHDWATELNWKIIIQVVETWCMH